MIALWLMLTSAANAQSPVDYGAPDLLKASLEPSKSETVRSGPPWWASLPDPALHELIRTGLQHNPELAAAEAQVRASQAGQGQALSGLLPSITLELQGQQMPTDGIGLSPFSSQMPDYGAAFEGLSDLMASMAALTGQDPSALPSFETDTEPLPDTYSQGSAMLVATLPIDIVGRQTHSYLASRRSAASASADLDARRLGTTLRITDGWYDLVAARSQVRLVAEQVSTNRTLLSLIQARYEGGEASALDVLQQRQQLAATQTMLPRAHAQLAAADLALRTQLGISPSEGIADTTVLPVVGPAPALASPEQLRTHRPDLAAAIARLDAARYQRTSALLGLAPTLGITGSAGRQFLHMEELDHVDTWSVGAAMSVPLFLGGRTHAGIRSATAQRDLAHAQLRARVLAVTQEVHTASIDDGNNKKILEAAGVRSKAAKAAFDESRARFIEGIIPYVNVLTALTAHQTAELALLEAQRARLRARVRLHGALGSHWAPSPSPEDTP